MSHFTYTAEKTGGEIYKGAADAPDRFEVYRIIRREGGKLLFLEEDTLGKRLLTFSYWSSFFSTLPEQERILFVRNVGSMLKAGLPLSRALAVIERQTRNYVLKHAASDIASDVRHGETLHDAMAKYPRVFSSLVVAMVRSGEEGGDLAASLLTAAEQIERANDVKKKVRGALIYPSIILIAIVGIGALMMVEVVPTLSSTFKEMGAQLPLPTQIIIGISDFLVSYTYYAIALAAAVILGVYFGLRTRQGKFGVEFVLMRLPAIGQMVREINSARTSRTLASLTSAGVDVLTALVIARDVVQNSYFKDILIEAETDVRGGKALSSTFMRHENIYPPLVGEMMAVGEETGQTAQMLEHLATFYEMEVDRKTRNLSTIIEPLLMVFVGGAVGFFAISMITPIYSLSQNI